MHESQDRKIIHIDADCFFAAVEIRENPKLVGRPVAVGGSPERRGVIATCNYEARQFGVHSAMASAKALQLCPGLIILKPRMSLYQQVSQQLRMIFFEYTDRVEPLSLDEAYLDVSLSQLCRGSATLIAQAIRQKVWEREQLTVSAGVAPNKFLAKIASDWQKPDGLFVISPEQINDFILKLPVAKLPGVGKVTAKKMHQLGVASCEDLQQVSTAKLKQHFGVFGERLYLLARGIDQRPVQPLRRRKSLSVEHTFSQDLPDLAAVQQSMPSLYEALCKRLERSLDEGYEMNKRFVKLKFSDFTQTTYEERWLAHDTSQLSVAAFQSLAEYAFKRGEGKAVRLIGIGVGLRDRSQDCGEQLVLF
ncbi:DNA polymerase IV [Zooshikella ganghwensis]|uniref:DNA polymerase IV n=1 Tax=Zooshikella ganghwensis TaxID=202772 RepID=UPI00041572CA|nr:DNA polymerase IV [Zooshikella ganghwensis]